MELLRYMVRKGHHGRKDDDGNTVISKPGDPILISLQTAKKLGDSVRPWPDDKPWPTSDAPSGGEAALKTTQGTTPADHAARKAAEKAARDKAAQDDGHQVKEKG